MISQTYNLFWVGRVNILNERLITIPQYREKSQQEDAKQESRYINEFVDSFRGDKVRFRMMLLDLDHFKEEKDSYGHLARRSAPCPYCRSVQGKLPTW